jgi:glycosyltransferase involved in cell wall biosynthesis
MYPPLKRLVYRTFDTLTSYLASANVAVSHAVAAQLRRQGYAAGKLHVIHNGAPIPEPLPLRSTASEPIRVGVVARLSPEKGHSGLLHATRKIATAMPGRAQFIIIGQGPEERRLRDLSRQLDLGSHVIFRGYCSDMAEEYANLDLVVLPSIDFEGLPMALLEAMSYGMPVVCTSVGGCAEAVHEEAGFLVPPRDADGLAKAIVTLVQDETLRKKMGRAARERTRRFLSVETMARAYQTLYLELAKA